MLILACDTSGPVVSAAIWQDQRLLAETSLRSPNPHAVTLMPLIKNLLRESSLTIQEIKAYACAVGPGSFTGIRIGISSIKAMAYAAGCPAIGISSLLALAWPYACCTDQIICPVIDARNHRIFASAWQGDRQLLAEANWQDQEYLAALQQLAAAGAEAAAPSFVLAGHQPDNFFSAAGLPLLPNLHLAPAAAAWPRSAVIAALAQKQLQKGVGGLPQDLSPVYLSLSQAERRQEANHV